MALIKCPDCGKEVSDRALNCPYCGAPMIVAQNKNRASNTLSWVLGIIGAIVGWYIFS